MGDSESITSSVTCELTTTTRPSPSGIFASMHLVLAHVAKNQEMICAALDSEFGFTCKIDGHKQDDASFLQRRWGTRTFCVVDHSDVGKWIEKASQEARRDDIDTVVCLCPARTNTDYFHEIILKHASSLRFVKGRLKMQNHRKQSPFPSCIVVFGAAVASPPLPPGDVFARPNLEPIE
jgi:hypothetical protein